MSRPIPPRNEYDGGRLLPKFNGYRLDELRPRELLGGLTELLLSPDPMDRVDAARRLYLLERCVWTPPGCWAAQSRYRVDPMTGQRWSDNTLTWSTHLTREEAERWHAAWSARWAERRPDYEMLPVRQLTEDDKVPLHYLRHPDAEPNV